MNPRKLIGRVVLVTLVVVGLSARFLTGVHQDEWPVLIRILFGLAVCFAIFAAFYDRANFAEKDWDFSPKRGLLYFCVCWLIYPVLIAIDLLFDANFSWTGVLLGTAIMAVVAGVAGTFTENVGL